MVIDNPKHTRKTPVPQGSPEIAAEPNKIGSSTHYDFEGKNLTPYGGLFPVATMLEKLGFQKLIEEKLTVRRVPGVMSMYQFVLSMVLAVYVGFSRLNHIRFVAKDPMLTRILRVWELPVQSTFWRFLASLHLSVAGQLLQVQRVMRERVWAAANVQLTAITLDSDTTVHTLYGQQMGSRKSYNPRNRGKKSYPPILTFVAETREYIAGELRTGDRPDGKQIARHLAGVFAVLPRGIQKIFARVDAGFYCWEAVEAYEQGQAQFIMVARKTSRLVAKLHTADWKRSPKTDADEQCEFCYQPEGWGQAYRFIALRYKKKDQTGEETRAVSTVRQPGIHLSGVRHQHGRSD